MPFQDKVACSIPLQAPLHFQISSTLAIDYVEIGFSQGAKAQGGYWWKS